MSVEYKEGYIEIKADEGKCLNIDDMICHGGAFPLDYDLSKIEEIDEIIEDEEE